jgi:hypothetical protein
MKQKTRIPISGNPCYYLVAGAIKVYSWKNQTRTLSAFRESLEKFLEQNLTFSVKDMEKLWVIKPAEPTITGKSKKHKLINLMKKSEN